MIMRSTFKQKMISLLLIVAGVFAYGFTFDRGWLALLGPTIYDFLDPISGFLLSALLALCAISLTVYYFIRNSHHSKSLA